jgi:hypothetical protein
MGRPISEYPSSPASEWSRCVGIAGERDWGAMPPVTRYVKSGDIHLAYQVVGEAVAAPALRQ